MAAAIAPKPAVGKVQELLHRRFKVILNDDRVIMGDFQCLDKQGNLILGNACEIIAHAAAAPSSSTSSSGGPCNGAAAGGGGSGRGTPAPGAPMEKALGIVLVPEEQQKDVLLMVTLSEKAAMLKLAES